MRRKLINRKNTNLIFFLLLYLLIFGCSPVKKLKDGELQDGIYSGREYLVRRNIIIEKNKFFEPEILNTFIRQQPNRKLFKTIPFFTWLYNSVNQEKLTKKKTERNLKYEKDNARAIIKNEEFNKKKDAKRDRKNKRRALKGKPLLKQRIPKKPKLKNPEDLTFLEKIQEIGEAPVILDTFLTNTSVKQLKKYCANNGYFNAVVTDSIVYEPKGKKKMADVFYILKPGKPYKIRSIKYKIEDSVLSNFVLSDTAFCKIKETENYQADILTAERERIYKTEINNGYFEFAQDYIYFLIDTNLNSHMADITIGIKSNTSRFKVYWILP